MIMFIVHQAPSSLKTPVRRMCSGEKNEAVWLLAKTAPNPQETLTEESFTEATVPNKVQILENVCSETTTILMSLLL